MTTMMQHRRRSAASWIAIGLIAGGAAHSAVAQPALTQPGTESAACDAAGTAAEHRYELPTGLLRAIGRVESGRRDATTGQLAPWPYTINADGRGRVFDTAAEAVAATRTLQQSGVGSIDVGCFQINLMHHPLAFPTLEDGFDPAANADYAARFLLSLKSKAGAWEPAVANYHSAMPERGFPYRDRVLAMWSHDGGGVPPLAPAANIPLVVRAMTWSPSSGSPGVGGMRVWTPSPPGQGAAVIRMTKG